MPIGPILDDTSLVIDTDILNDWRYGKLHTQKEISEYVARFKRPPALASVSVFEALNGFESKFLKPAGNDERTRSDLAKTEDLIQLCTVLSFDEQAARMAAYVFARLSRGDKNKHWRDVFVVATALSHGHGVAKESGRLYLDC